METVRRIISESIVMAHLLANDRSAVDEDATTGQHAEMTER